MVTGTVRSVEEAEAFFLGPGERQATCIAESGKQKVVRAFPEAKKFFKESGNIEYNGVQELSSEERRTLAEILSALTGEDIPEDFDVSVVNIGGKAQDILEAVSDKDTGKLDDIIKELINNTPDDMKDKLKEATKSEIEKHYDKLLRHASRLAPGCRMILEIQQQLSYGDIMYSKYGGANKIGDILQAAMMGWEAAIAEIKAAFDDLSDEMNQDSN